jgi:hypothetical protein
MSQRANALADRLELGVSTLTALARGLTDEEWQFPIPKDGRKIGVVVHHVASMFPIEIQLAQTLAKGEAVVGLTWDMVHKINAEHAQAHDGVTKEEALELLKKNSAEAAAAIRALSDKQLDLAATVSMYGGAVLTCQFALEDHAVRHAFWHVAKIRAALRQAEPVAQAV